MPTTTTTRTTTTTPTTTTTSPTTTTTSTPRKRCRDRWCQTRSLGWTAARASSSEPAPVRRGPALES
jgi:hypothetical protein